MANQYFISKWHPNWEKKKMLYLLNDLAFQGEYALKNNQAIKEVLMPSDSMMDEKNPKGDYLWNRYIWGACYFNYPNRYYKQAVGLSSKGDYKLQLPESMKRLEDYATLQNLSIQEVENQLLKEIITYGSALLVTRIPDEVNTATDTPKIEVIPGCDVLDAKTVYDKEKGLDLFERVVYYKDQQIYDYNTNTYNRHQIYIYIKAIDANGRYYEAKVRQEDYQRFNLLHPEQSDKFYMSLSYPEWIGPIKFVPCVYINKDNLKCKWVESPVQNLVNISLSLFQLYADIRFIMSQQASSTLVIAGTDMEGKPIRTGCGNVLNLTDSGSNANYIAPSVAGLTEMEKNLSELHTLAYAELLGLTEAGGKSAEAIALTIQEKRTELVGLINIIGKGMQRQLEYIANIIGEDIDQVIFEPFIDFINTDTKKVKQDLLTQESDIANNEVKIVADKQTSETMEVNPDKTNKIPQDEQMKLFK